MADRTTEVSSLTTGNHAKPDHECGLYYAERPCCAARAGEPGDYTLGGAAAHIIPPAKCPVCPHEPHGQWCQNAAGEPCSCDRVFSSASTCAKESDRG